MFVIEELESIKSHVHEDEARVWRQREIIVQLKGRNLSIEAAQMLLCSFEASLARHQSRLDQALLHREARRATSLGPWFGGR
ncbi:MAG: hypothetical protein ACREFW_02725 [Rhizomicrobium sp.]